MSRRIAAILAVCVALATACAGTDAVVPATELRSVTALTPVEDDALAASPADRAGEVHVHEDGFVHTHGAGAPEEWIITYTAEGLFVPERLDILAGDTVTFVNESEWGVWPASNIHPTHEIYPEFDPLREIPPGESWSFTFSKNGYWRYHNHSYASETGLIVVSGAPDEDLLPLDMEVEVVQFPAPPADSGGERIATDANALYDYVVQFGPAAAVADLKATELLTGLNCHNAAHDVGRIAYEEFGPAAFVIAGHDCQAGALHGAIEALFAERGTSRLAEDVAAVCSASEDSFVMHQCLHGVGHGIMAWTTYELHEALVICDVLSGQQHRASCHSGVFMENVVGGLSGLMGHETSYLRFDDPHFPCDVVETRYVPGCYFYQTSHMVTVYAGDMASVAKACSEAPENARSHCFASYGRDVGGATRGDPERAVAMCRHAPGPHRSACINGAVQDRFWEPAGANEAIRLCSLADPSEAAGCWDTIIERAKFMPYDFAARAEFCNRVTDEAAHIRCQRTLVSSDGS